MTHCGPARPQENGIEVRRDKVSILTTLLRFLRSDDGWAPDSALVPRMPPPPAHLPHAAALGCAERKRTGDDRFPLARGASGAPTLRRERGTGVGVEPDLT